MKQTHRHIPEIGIQRFALIGERAPGFPLAIATLPDGRVLTLGMKAGGFGDDDTLARAAAYLCAPNKMAIK